MTGKSMNETVIELSEVKKVFVSGGEDVEILKGINLKVAKGEMLAIVGQSGSGKSTLMNIMGCLDKPSSGTYKVFGKDVSGMEPDDLARLRREHFGFIFQRYHLLGDVDALGNVEVPAIYAGMDEPSRRKRGGELLGSLGLADRMDHKPGELSGGQQQRVSIARALMNGGDIILADEPTGALDSRSGIEVMEILKDLNRKGHTVIIVTHDMNIARNAGRIIEIKDGEILSDTTTREPATGVEPPPQMKKGVGKVERLKEATKMAMRSIMGHRLRSFLTMLGIIIGIASVISVVSIGNGSKKMILQEISNFGTNTLHIFRGNPKNRASRRYSKLDSTDLKVLKALPFVDAISPVAGGGGKVKFDEIETSANINGVSVDYFKVEGLQLEKGHFFTQKDVDNLQAAAVIDSTTVKTYFADKNIEPVGQILIIGNVPMRVVGVLKDKNQEAGNTPRILMPYTTVTNRLLGSDRMWRISLKIKDGVDTKAAEGVVKQLLIKKHGTEDFEIMNVDTVREAIDKITGLLTLFISSIAVISLIVGGIGVMNIMLVSVTERTQEIGVRMAVGARRSDIKQQFLIEAIILCLVGGVIGILLALGIGKLIDMSSDQISVIFSVSSMVVAVACSMSIGLIFGFLPANNASKLDPVVALSRE